jgi:NAD(P)-dependent dehydrogenase (short-subunit alcohol dehydrogenase family)
MTPIPQSDGLPDTIPLDSFGAGLNVAIVGAGGAIGRAFSEILGRDARVARLSVLSRGDPALDLPGVSWQPVDIEREATIEAAAKAIRASGGDLHLVIVATGILHDGDGLQPEKSLRALDAAALETAFRINTIGPSLVAKHFLPLLARRRKSAFAALSARVGSISDNRLGGWHAYRASKAALNMMVRTLAIELKRSNPEALCVALHPGTVDSRLSKPFQSNVPDGKLFSPDTAARHLLTVLDSLAVEHSGRLFAWDGAEIPF